MAAKKEDIMGKRILSFLKDLEKQYNIFAETKKKVISDFNFDRNNEDFNILVSFTELDIALFKKIPLKESSIPKIFNFFRADKTDKDWINVPFIIIELKVGDKDKRGITSDQIRARNEVARKLKSVYPFSSYLFIAENTSKKPQTVFKHGNNFDDFYLFKDLVEENDMKEIKEGFIIPRLNNLKRKGIL